MISEEARFAIVVVEATAAARCVEVAVVTLR